MASHGPDACGAHVSDCLMEDGVENEVLRARPACFIILGKPVSFMTFLSDY